MKDLLVKIDVGGQHREQVLDVAGKLGDGKTSFDVSVGRADTRGFIAVIAIAARDGRGVVVAQGSGIFNGSGDACNFFGVTLGAGGTDGAHADLPGDTSRPDGPSLDQRQKASDIPAP